MPGTEQVTRMPSREHLHAEFVEAPTGGVPDEILALDEGRRIEHDDIRNVALFAAISVLKASARTAQTRSSCVARALRDGVDRPAGVRSDFARRAVWRSPSRRVAEHVERACPRRAGEVVMPPRWS